MRKQTRKGEKTYISYVVSLPKDLVEALGFDRLDHLELEVRPAGDRLEIVLREPGEGSP